MEKAFISSGSSFEALAGYSRAVVEGGYVHVSGTTGFDYVNMTIDDDLVAQTEQALRNITDALARAGAGPNDVVRVHYFLTERSYFERVAPLFGRFFAKGRPAATALIVGLVDARMKIEIEVTACLPEDPSTRSRDGT